VNGMKDSKTHRLQWASRCPRSGTYTKRRGSRGLIIPPTGRTSSMLFAGSTAKSCANISPGEHIRMLVNSAADEKTAAALPEGAQELTRARSSSLGHPQSRLDAGQRAHILFGAPGTEGRRPPSSISISTPGKYSDWKKDRQVPEVAARHLSKAHLPRAISATVNSSSKGVGIEVNGGAEHC